MNWIHKIGIRLRALFQKRELDAELDEELRFHIEQQTKGLPQNNIYFFNLEL
jgi:hypothetical protein